MILYILKNDQLVPLQKNIIELRLAWQLNHIFIYHYFFHMNKNMSHTEWIILPFTLTPNSKNIK